MPAKRVASAKQAKEKTAAKSVEARLRRAREIVETVLWNLDHSTEDADLGNARVRANWRTVFQELQKGLQ